MGQKWKDTLNEKIQEKKKYLKPLYISTGCFGCKIVWLFIVKNNVKVLISMLRAHVLKFFRKSFKESSVVAAII